MRLGIRDKRKVYGNKVRKERVRMSSCHHGGTKWWYKNACRRIFLGRNELPNLFL